MEKQSSSERVRAHVFITGNVHGVGYRLATWDKANQWGIGGWVEEIPDGRVEAVFEGNKELVEAIIRWCYRGSPDAVVKTVTTKYEEPEGLKDFIIRRPSDVNIKNEPKEIKVKTINAILFVHGVIPHDCNFSETKLYDLLWEPVKKHYNLSERIDEIISVNWGHYLAETNEARLDETLSKAEEFIAKQINFRSPPHNTTNNFSLQPWWRSLVQPLQSLLFSPEIGAAIYYNGIAGKTALQLAVYQQIVEFLEKYRHQIEKNLSREEVSIKIRLHAISSGLGASIVNDFLHGLFFPTGERIRNYPEQAKEPIIASSHILAEEKQETVERYLFWCTAAQKKHLELGSIVSMASQLPVLFLSSQRVINTFANQETLSVDEIGIPQQSQEIIWKVFYDIDDLSAFSISPLFGNHPAIEDIAIQMSNNYSNYSSYWVNGIVHTHVAELLNRRVVS
ncbi:acylphosphatase [Aerosakkonemataceae cyanobacterium BLCC-F154]|uniref:Acylphosphatase n=1 Tax=Floridaenema fluviatile BLCC-F154 TaxID=3153640 RepID=A0ABV4YKJ4_9CYAN